MKSNYDIMEVLPSETLLPEEMSAIVGGKSKTKIVGCNGNSCSCSDSISTSKP